jgi:O-antigen/teichoic acid export membrane protein
VSLPGVDALRDVIQRLLRNPLLRRVVRNSGYVFSGNTLSAALSFVQSVLAARLLGVEGLGLLGFITLYSTVVNRITSFDMSRLVVTYVGRFSVRGDKAEAAAVFKAAGLAELVSSLLAYVLILVTSGLAARYIAKDPALAGLFMLYGLTLLANLIAESSTGLLQHFDRFRAIAIISVGQSALTLMLILVAFLRHGDLRSVVVAYLLGKVVWAGSLTFVALWQAHHSWGWAWLRAPLSVLRPHARELLRFSLNINLSSTLQLLTRDSELLWIGAFTSPLQAGYYKIAKAIVNALTIPITPLIRTTYRELAREVGSKNWENVRYLIRSGTILSSLWTVPGGIGLVVLGRWVVSIYGSEFLPTSYYALLILLLGTAAANVFYWNQSPLLALGMAEYPTKVKFVGAALKIAGTFLLVPVWGALGMAILYSAYLLETVLVLVWKSLQQIRRAELVAAYAPGG